MDIAIQSSVYVSSPEFAGWLTKRGFHWRKLWKKRWIALHGAEIVYMDKEPNIDNCSSLTVTKAHVYFLLCIRICSILLTHVCL
jgi:hypothetical protein